MAFSFETHALPILLQIAEDPLGQSYPLKERIIELGLAKEGVETYNLISFLYDGGLVDFTGNRSPNGQWRGIRRVRLTVASLQQLDLWPSDNERGLYLAKRMSEAFERMAQELATSPGSDPEEVSRLRTAAGALVQFGSAVIAQVVATKITG